MAVRKLKRQDIRFEDEYDGQKMRRLNDELSSSFKTINQVIEMLGQAESDGGAFQHVLATTAGLGGSHTVTELSPGMVLTAISDDNAAFRQLDLDDLSDVATDSAEDGDVLIRSGNLWVAQALPGLSALQDPGDNLIVYWNEDEDDLDYLGLGTGLLIAGGMLVLDASVLDHGELAGLTDDDHPQYPLIAFPETISGDWAFTGEILFERNPIDILFRDSGGDTDEQDWHLTISAEVLSLALATGLGDEDSILNVTRSLGNIALLTLADVISIAKNEGVPTAIEHSSYGEAVLHSFYGDLQLLDDGALYIGEAGEISLRYDETDSFITTAGDVWWDNVPALDIGGTLTLGFDFAVLRAQAPEFILFSEEANENEGAWGQRAESGLLQHAVLNDDGSIGEAWASIIAVDGLVEEIALSGTALTFNGLRVLTEDDLP